jgi:excisionase family DNA binding protein
VSLEFGLSMQKLPVVAPPVLPISLERLYKAPEAAKYLSISTRTLFKYCAERLIGFHRYKGGFRFRQTDLDFFLARNYVPAIQRKAA